MEDIMNKNIFENKELKKLEPDYIPPNTLLRLQTRSAMVKDTHSHKHRNDNAHLQRKIIKRPKDCYKVNKEIVKIRNAFESLHLKNQIMMKNAVKYVDTLKATDFERFDVDEYETLEVDAEKYLKDISEKNDIAIHNHSGFKLEDKPKVSKRVNLDTYHKTKKPVPLSEKEEEFEEFAVEDFLRIECTLHKPSMSSENIMLSETTDQDQNCCETSDINDIVEIVNYPTPRNQIEDVNNLQGLLIMMAITPKATLTETCTDVAPRNEEKYCIGSTLELQHTSMDVMNNYNVNEVLTISPIKIEIKDKIINLMRKYAVRWKMFVNSQKDKRAREREEKFNSFFYKLEKKKEALGSPSIEPVNKAKVLARDFSRYRHRYQVQKHIIALQKAKLEEQSRIIEELKYNRIVEASKISIDAMKDEIRKTYNDIDKQLKPKLKCLTNELKLADIEEPSLVLHCLKVPQFLQRMEKRAREREEKHAMIRERRKQMEEERIKMKQQEELARALMDKEEKIKRMKELKDKRKREKIENIRKKQHAERMRALTVMADLHYEKNLMGKYGIKPFKMLIALKRDRIEKSEAHYKFQLKKNVFLRWMFYTEDMWYERNFRADDFYKKKLLRYAFDAFKRNYCKYILKKQVADDYYDLYVTSLVFKKFREGIQIVKMDNEKKWQKAVMYNNCVILFKTFTCWRSLPALNALKREQEIRKARWREKVLQVIPDYSPPDD